MSRDWTPAELQAVSAAMERAGQPSYEQFCAELAEIGFPLLREGMTDDEAEKRP